MPETQELDLASMTAEVLAWCQEKGWYDTPVSFAEAMALLHSEVSEALEAWRVWGLEDFTAPAISAGPHAVTRLSKPEGVGSEFADILIRLLDDAARFGVDLAAELAEVAGRFGLPESFGEQMNMLHQLISMAYRDWEDDFTAADFVRVGPSFARIYVFLVQLCETHGIDLQAEYTRKMAYNRTRAYRNGGKRS